MISAERNIYCLNPNCEHPLNSIGNILCTSCQTPITYRYLWATGSIAAKITPGTKVLGRYEVITEQIWLDTQPGTMPEMPTKLPAEVIPYLKLFPQRLHCSQAYGFTRNSVADESDILLLENIPVDETGSLYPKMSEAWEQATAVRQVYWLWQILQLWTPLLELGKAESLLIPDNLRVQGSCLKLIELHPNTEEKAEQNIEQLGLRDLGYTWRTLLALSKASIAQELDHIVQQMLHSEVDLAAINTQVNQLLVASASELPLIMTMAGATDIGPILQQNEDTCYPSNSDELDEASKLRLAIICDGIGGHEGGEVASQLAIQSLKLQIRSLLAEVAQQTELIPPDILHKQLEASLRIVNNVIWSRNDEQKRQGKERMATTLVMALQIPQKVVTTSGWLSDNTHELYLASIGDSRAYWMTREYCQLLTIDDDITGREVRAGRLLYRQAIHNANANALAQALGTKEAESLNFSIKRFILEEDGILLLCSDGLSDQNWVEQSWKNYAIPLLTGEMTVDDAVHHWINLAHEKKAQDNISVVLTLYRVTIAPLVPVISSPTAIENIEAGELAVISAEVAISPLDTIEEPLAESSLALLDLVEVGETRVTLQPSRSKTIIMIGGLLVVLVGICLGIGFWYQVYPKSFQKMCRPLPKEMQRLCPHR